MDPSWVISRVIFEVVTWWLTPGMVREITSRFVRHGTSFSHVPMAGGMRHWHTWLVLSKMVWKTHPHLDIRDDSKWPTLFIRVNQNYLRFLNMGRDTSLGGCTLHDTWVVSCLNLSKSSHNIPHLSADSQTSATGIARSTKRGGSWKCPSLDNVSLARQLLSCHECLFLAFCWGPMTPKFQDLGMDQYLWKYHF